MSVVADGEYRTDTYIHVVPSPLQGNSVSDQRIPVLSIGPSARLSRSSGGVSSTHPGSQPKGDGRSQPRRDGSPPSWVRVTEYDNIVKGSPRGFSPKVFIFFVVEGRV